MHAASLPCWRPIAGHGFVGVTLYVGVTIYSETQKPACI